MTVLAAILPIFILIVLGYGMGRRAWLSTEAANGLGKLAFQVLMPVLLFTGMAQADLRHGFSLALLMAYFLPVLALFTLVNVLAHRRLGHCSPFGLTASYSNNVLIGIPLVLNLFGQEGLIYVFAVLAFHSLLLFNLQSFYDATALGKSLSARTLLTSLANPLVIGLVLGVIVNLAGLELPAPMAQVLTWLAGAALPCALLVLGTHLSRYRLRPTRIAVALAFTKLVLAPLAVLSACLAVGLNPMAVAVLTLMAACPSGVNVLGFAQTAEDNRNVSSAVTLSTVLAVLTVPCWVWLAQHMAA